LAGGINIRRINMKRLLIILLALILAGCGGFGFKSDSSNISELEAKVKALEEKIDDIEMFGAGGVGANFYPARGLTGGAAGDLDKITSTNDGDVGFVVLHDDATYGDAILIYVLDDDSACGEDDTGQPPRYFIAPDDPTGATECWELANIYALSSVSPMKVVAHSSGNDTLTVDEVTNTYIYVTVAADFTLPEIGTLAEVMGTVNMVPVGSSFCVHTVGAIQIDIDPHANNSITLDGTEDTNGHRIENTATAGDMICLVACDSNGWCAPSNPDSWVAGGV
jgi:outer membrane murein-binding lipoprotein Lpp